MMSMDVHNIASVESRTIGLNTWLEIHLQNGDIIAMHMPRATADAMAAAYKESKK
jgi:hypothetical protein